MWLVLKRKMTHVALQVSHLFKINYLSFALFYSIEWKSGAQPDIFQCKGGFVELGEIPGTKFEIFS